MSDRLQKSLGVTQSVASRGSAPQKVDTTSQAVQTAGMLVQKGVEVAGEMKVAETEEKVEALGREIFAARNGKELEETSERFKKLQKAKEQGMLTDTMVKIEAEKVIKEHIGSNGFYGDEIKAEAAKILGFDPTGAQVRALYGSGERSRPLTAEQKKDAQALDISQQLGLDYDKVRKNMAKAEYGEIQLANASNQARLGEIGANGVLSTSLANLDSYVVDASTSLMAQIAEGGVNAVDSASSVLMLNNAKEQAFNRHIKAITDSGTSLSPEQLSSHRKQFDDKFAPITEMFADTATMETLLVSQKAQLSAQAGIQGFDLFPGLAAINSAMGQAGVSEYFSVTSNMSDPTQLELLKKISPQFASVADNKSDAAKAMRSSYNRIMGIPEDTASATDPALDQAVASNIVTNAKEPEVRKNVVAYLKGRGKPFQDFEVYAQKGARANASSEEVSYIKERFDTEYDSLVTRVSNNLNQETAVLQMEGGKIVAKPNILKRGAGNFAPDMSISSDLKADITRLNAMNKLAQNGWATDLGVNADKFLTDTSNRISGVQVEQEQASEKQASELSEINEEMDLDAFAKANPELYAEALRMAEEGD